MTDSIYNLQSIPPKILLPAHQLVELLNEWLQESPPFYGTHFITTNQYLHETLLSVTQTCAEDLHTTLLQHNNTRLILTVEQERKLVQLHQFVHDDISKLLSGKNIPSLNTRWLSNLTLYTDSVIKLLALWQARAESSLETVTIVPLDIKAGDDVAFRRLLDYFRAARYLQCHQSLYRRTLVLVEQQKNRDYWARLPNDPKSPP